MTQPLPHPIDRLDSCEPMIPDDQRSPESSYPSPGFVAFTCREGHFFFLRSTQAETLDWVKRSAGQECSSAFSSLDRATSRISESLKELKKAKHVNLEEVIEQFKAAAKSAESIRGYLLSEVPEAAWQDRTELNAHFKEIQESVEARSLEQIRTRLLALATELDLARIVHCWAVSVDPLKRPRDQATEELRFQAGPQEAPQILRDARADQWIEWAARGPNEREHSLFLKTLRLDDFATNLEPSVWRDASSVVEVSAAPKNASDKPREERSCPEPSGSRTIPTLSEPIPKEPEEDREDCGDPRAHPCFPETSMSTPGANRRTSRFRIYRRPERALVDPKTVDHEMFAHFGEQPDGMGYYLHWDESIASRIAMGEELGAIRAHFVRQLVRNANAASQKGKACRRNYQRLIEIADWLDQHFTLQPAATISTSSKCK